MTRLVYIPFVQNYDFGRNWDKVWPHINTPEAKKWIRKAWRSIKRNRGWKVRYQYRQPPSNAISSSDGYVMMIDRILDEVIETNYPAVVTDADREILFEPCPENEDDIDHDDYRDLDVRFDILRRLGLDYRYNKGKLCFYIPFHTCHWWNPHFSLPLARKVLPDRNWTVRRGEDHTTVYCKETNEVFDMIYWGLDNRLEEYQLAEIRGEPIEYSCSDPSLGGNMAYIDSM